MQARQVSRAALARLEELERWARSVAQPGANPTPPGPGAPEADSSEWDTTR